jgi:hypothetical protein
MPVRVPVVARAQPQAVIFHTVNRDDIHRAAKVDLVEHLRRRRRIDLLITLRFKLIRFEGATSSGKSHSTLRYTFRAVSSCSVHIYISHANERIMTAVRTEHRTDSSSALLRCDMPNFERLVYSVSAPRSQLTFAR